MRDKERNCVTYKDRCLGQGRQRRWFDKEKRTGTITCYVEEEVTIRPTTLCNTAQVSRQDKNYYLYLVGSLGKTR